MDRGLDGKADLNHLNSCESDAYTSLFGEQTDSFPKKRSESSANYNWRTTIYVDESYIRHRFARKTAAGSPKFWNSPASCATARLATKRSVMLSGLRSTSSQTASPTASFPHPRWAFRSGFRMRSWSASKANRVLAALQRIGWKIKRQRGSHRLLTRAGWTNYEFSFHENAEIGPRMLSRIAKHTGLTPEDL